MQNISAVALRTILFVGKELGVIQVGVGVKFFLFAFITKRLELRLWY